MSGQWYYSHDGVTHGPFSEAELQQHVARRLVLESDWLWPVGSSPKDATPAGASFDFSQASGPVATVPDWLADVAAAETTGPAPGLEPSDETPEWLEDLRLWVGLELYTPVEIVEDETPSDPTSAGEIPDWLESWLTPPKPKAPQPDSAPPPAPAPAVPAAVPVSPPRTGKTPPVSAPAQPTILPTVPVVSPPFPSPPTTGPAATPKTPASAPVSPKAKAPAAGPAPAATAPAATVPAQAKTKPDAPKAASPLIEKTLQGSGFDLETGQILDAEKFRKWKQQQAQASAAGQPALSNASLFEVFRKARTAIEAWVDDEKNRPSIMHADPEEIKRKPEIQSILLQYANYGKAMQEKLLRHLEFMVENRRKYYKAVAAVTKG